ncbi:uncharacterized protein LOC133177057 [Saccostrea echinata]|uniref:uncharacterized protein LOC133177057 n=1 Tax=Saccostrea echinata TaxID=191078 RepID=UPI002A7FDCD1|nr:uncharacterized protein LOC133177057 [Saccostrea echinata]
MISKLRAVRAGQRSAVTRLLKRLDEENTDSEDIETILDTLTEKQEVLRDLDEKILTETAEEETEKEILETDEYNLNLNSKMRKFKKQLLVQKSSLNATATSYSHHNENSQFGENGQSSHNFSENSRAISFHSNSNSSNSSNFHKLPKLNLPIFEGNVLEWQSFWDSFDSAIHSNNTLTEVQKFNYLKSLVEGEASNTIAGFALTHSNYNRAIELLHERFGQKHKIIQSYMQALLELPAPKNNLTSLRHFHDQVETYVRGLESYGQAQETYGSLLVPVILNKLPSELRKNLAREHGSTNWLLGDLRNSLYRELEILEAGASIDATEPSATATFYTHSKSSNKQLQRNSSPRKPQVSCAFCKESHRSNDCTKYKNFNDRMRIVKRDKLCFNCLGRHRVADCQSKFNCKTCKKRHHTSLCSNHEEVKPIKESIPSFQSKITERTETSVMHSSSHRDQPNVLLQTAVAPVTFGKLTTDANILFDEGAQRSFISRSLADKIELTPTGYEDINILGFGDSGKDKRVQKLQTALIKVQTIQREEIPVKVLVVPEIAAPIKTHVETAAKLSHLRNLRLAHPVAQDDAFQIELLIGADQYWNLVEDEIVRGKGPTAIKSKLGYLLSGPLYGSQFHVVEYNTSMMNVMVSHKMEEHNIEKFWQIEAIGSEKEYEESSNQDFHLSYEKDSIRFQDNRYHVRLPWKEDHPTLPLNKDKAYHRTVSVINRLKMEPKMLIKYGEIIAEQERRGFIEKVDSKLPTNRKVHFIPHFPVKKDSVTTPVRIVYDCSCHETPNTASLNDCLMNIPPQLNDIASILLRFRLNKYAVTTDIEKAFLNVGLEEEDRDVTRFFWFDEPTNPNGQLVNYRFKSVLFGATCSPFILNAVLMKHLKENASTWTQKLTENLYVDNIISSFPTENELISFYNCSRTLFAKAGFNLRSWGSNSEILQEHAKKDGVLDKDSVVKVLGMKWNVKEDTLTFAKQEIANTKKNTVTKREVVKQSSKIYDPLGYISPITVKAKMFIQELWKKKIDWDQKLPQELADKWIEIAQNTEKATSLEIPRMCIHENPPETTVHIFSDASIKAYGACAYIVSGDQSSLIMAKNRVAPLKTLTIPKLELMGALLGARLLKFIKKNIQFSEAVLWTDSQIVLSWLETTKTLGTFVRNRIQEIKKLTEQYKWRYCPTTSNPADILSRGTDFDRFRKNELWSKGPTWITDTNKWPIYDKTESHILANITESEKCGYQEEDSQEKRNVKLGAREQKISEIIDISKFNNYRKLLNVTSYVLRFIQNCSKKQKVTGPLTVSEIEQSSLIWIINAQQKNYPDIFGELQRDGKSKNCLSKQLKLYLDNEELIQCGGRIQNAPISKTAKHPILLPPNDQLTTLIILDAHRRNLHSGVNSTVTLLRQNYWIQRIRQSVKSVLRKCITCRKIMGKPYPIPEAPPLPKDRLREEPPFTVTGVDFTGALKVRKKNGHEGKVYICLFTCASTRAVHLELVTDLTEEQFILAFRRFSSRKSLPKLMISDNATTYVASSKEIEKLTSSHSLQETLNTHGTRWKFIPKRAPWYGGFWERLIGLTKNCLKKVLGRSFVNLDALNTIIVEIECILNDRPLTYASADPLDEDPLTPSHLLYGRKIRSLPYPGSSIDVHLTTDLNHSSANKAYNIQQQTIQHFWERWRKEYLTSLREYHRIHGKNKQNIQVGDIVQIYDERML